MLNVDLKRPFSQLTFLSCQLFKGLKLKCSHLINKDFFALLDYGELLYMNTPDQFIKESDTVTAVFCDLLQVADIMYITGPYGLSHWLTFI